MLLKLLEPSKPLLNPWQSSRKIFFQTRRYREPRRMQKLEPEAKVSVGLPSNVASTRGPNFQGSSDVIVWDLGSGQVTPRGPSLGWASAWSPLAGNGRQPRCRRDKNLARVVIHVGLRIAAAGLEERGLGF